MDRTIPAATRANLERPQQTESILSFLTIRHQNLSEPIRVVSDLFDYIKGGEHFIGVPFGASIVNDDGQRPSVEVRLQNIDRQIGAALRAASGAATVELEICSSEYFDQNVVPREEIGAAEVAYRLSGYELGDVSVDALEASGRAMLPDYAAEPWPAITTTAARCPGLYFR